MMERLTEWKDDKKLLAKAKFSGDFGSQNILQKLAEYEDLEEQGLLLRLPCKVGDTVWKVNKASKKITSHKVIKFEIEKSDQKSFTMQIWFDNLNFCFYSHFGKTVFLTKEEAEQKLKEMESK